MGCPIQTITSSGGIQVGAANYPRAGNWVRLVILNPTQLTPVNGDDGQSFNANQTQALLDALKGISRDDIVSLFGQGISFKTFPDAQRQALTTAFQELGGTLSTSGATYSGAANLGSGQWSLIGHTGLTPGLAEQNLDTEEAGISGFLNGSSGGTGSLNGYMQIVKTFSYQFVSPEYAPIDTPAPGSTATQNIMSIDGKPYASDDLTSQDASEGIQLLVLDPSTAKPTLNATYVRDPLLRPSD